MTNMQNNFYKSFENGISDYDAELDGYIKEELIRQQSQIEMIASENIVSKSVLQAQGSVLTNNMLKDIQEKYYGGCHAVEGLKNLQLVGQRSCLIVILLMFNHSVRKLIKLYF